MNKRTILVGALFFPCIVFAQAQKKDSIAKKDLSLVGVVDASVVDADGEDGSDDPSQDINTMVLTSHDVYLNKVGFQLSPMRFRVRGYNNTFEKTYINGVPFNDQLRGVFNYASIGAINNLTRNGDRTNYTSPGSYSFGALAGTKNILMRAGDYAKGGMATVSYANRNYFARTMLSYSTGLSDKGWALTALVGGRYSNEGVIEGTFYRNLSYALLVEKQFGSSDRRLTFTTFGSPVIRGQQNGSLQEVYDLRKNNLYNANWGYQNGVKRNARIVRAFDPTAILAYEGKLSEKIKLNSGLAFHFGRYGNTALNWFDGADPRPDYYRYLPSYFLANGSPDAAAYYARLWQAGNPAFTQVNWDNMIAANRMNKMMGDGSAIYLVENRCSDLMETTFNVTVNANLTPHYGIDGGLVMRNSLSHQYKKVDDLLGADYVWDIDKYADTDYPGDTDQMQKDLNHPDRRVYKGGIIDYDFKVSINSQKLWLNQRYSKGHWEAYGAADLVHTNFYRDGLMRNGHHPNNSFGAGHAQDFWNGELKGGLTYKFSGRSLIQLNALAGTMAPLPNNTYISARYSDAVPENLKSGKVLHADISYLFSTPRIQGRISAFNTNFFDLTERSTYYYDGVTLVNHVLTGVNKVFRGIEAAASYKIDNHWSVDLAGTVAQYYYANNPMGEFTTDNGKSLEDYDVSSKERVYMKHVYEGGVPQMAGTIGLRYFIHYWFLGANLNGFGNNYVSASPSRRVSSRYIGNAGMNIPAVTPYNKYYAAYKQFTHQEKFAGGCTLDLSIGKLFYIGRKRSISMNLAFNNILNKKDVKVGGYEQGRLNLRQPELFKNKYFYMQGFNCFLNLSYKF